MNNSDATHDRRQKFDRVVAVYHMDMFRYAAWLSRDKSIAEDVVQEALLRAWKSLDALRDDAAAGRMDGPRYLVSGPQLHAEELPTLAEVEPMLGWLTSTASGAEPGYSSSALP